MWFPPASHCLHFEFMETFPLVLLQGVITAQGKLLLQGSLQVCEQRSKGKSFDRANFSDRRIFLFEQIIIFSEEIQKKKNNLSNPGYIFKHSITVRVRSHPTTRIPMLTDVLFWAHR